MPPKWRSAQLPKAGHSSFINIPRYFIDGSRDMISSGSSSVKLARCPGLHPLHFLRGETPHISLNLYSPYMVPRRENNWFYCVFAWEDNQIMKNLYDPITQPYLFFRNTAKAEKSLPLTYYHRHNAYEIYLFLNGSRKVCVENAAYICRPGDLFIIPPETFHAGICDPLINSKLVEFLCYCEPLTHCTLQIS